MRPKKVHWPRCKQHKTYRAIYKPTGNCEACWAIWFFETYQTHIPYPLCAKMEDPENPEGGRWES